MRNNDVRIFGLTKSNRAEITYKRESSNLCEALINCSVEIRIFDLSCCQKHQFHIAEHWLAGLDSVMGEICQCLLSHSWRFPGYLWKTDTIGKSEKFFGLNDARMQWVQKSVFKILSKFVLAEVPEPESQPT